MYAIRSYYAMAAAEGDRKVFQRQPGELGGGKGANLDVITSYSIHYTKLYELSMLIVWGFRRLERRWHGHLRPRNH